MNDAEYNIDMKIIFYTTAFIICGGIYLETSTLNQLIESGGLIAITLVVMLFYRKLMKIKSNVYDEIQLLKDCYYLRMIIEKYKEEKKPNNYNKYRAYLTEKLGYSPSRKSEPAEIIKRLEYLKGLDKRLNEYINKMNNML